MSSKPEFAFYYPNPVWAHPDRIKNLILFFDGVALLVPSYLKDKPFMADPELAPALQDRGLLRILEPETFMTKDAAVALGRTMGQVLASGALDQLGNTPTQFHELSFSRLGYMADETVGKTLYEELRRRNLAQETRDGVSVPMHPMARALVLVLLAQLLRPAGRKEGLELCPATDRPEIHVALRELLSLPTLVSAAHVVSMDARAIGLDVSHVPLGELLDFRKANGKLYRKYARTLREFVRDARRKDSGERIAALRERRAEIRDLGSDVRAASRRAWRRGSAFALGVAGAAWKASQGDILGALLALGAGAAGAEFKRSVDTGAYSYIFAAKEKFA